MCKVFHIQTEVNEVRHESKQFSANREVENCQLSAPAAAASQRQPQNEQLNLLVSWNRESKSEKKNVIPIIK